MAVTCDRPRTQQGAEHPAESMLLAQTAWLWGSPSGIAKSRCSNMANTKKMGEGARDRKTQQRPFYSYEDMPGWKEGRAGSPQLQTGSPSHTHPARVCFSHKLS